MAPHSPTTGRASGRASFLHERARIVASVLPMRYFLLRAFTAGAAVLAGLVQTFVFARVLTPDLFSIYILIGTLGISLWLFDLGAAKILFVRQRTCFLQKTPDKAIAAQSSAVVVLYALIVAGGTLVCFAAILARSWLPVGQAADLALFFAFSALNLVWFPLRNVSNAVDRFVYFESLKSLRRIGHIGMTLALLAGLPLPVFLVLANLFWFVLIGTCFASLVREKALVAPPRGFVSALTSFWYDSRREILRSGNYAVGEIIVYSFPYLVVPAAFGLGAPTIILDTVFKVFRGATLIYAAGLDPLVPRQTRAFAERDAVALKRATWTAAVLCAVPTLALCALLLVAGDRIFAILLGKAATVPPAAIPVLVVLLLANLAQNVASSLLLHTGFFRELARVASFLILAMAVMTAIVLAAGTDIVGFLGGYAAVYMAGAAFYVSYAVRGPFRIAAQPKT